MKTSSLMVVTAASLCVLSCEKKEVDPATGERQLPASEIVEPAPPAAIPVTEPEDFKVAEEEPGNPDAPSPTPGQRLDHAIEKTEQGLETARDKTEQGLETARDKTEEGLRKAAEKTGNFLQRAGEAIEREAGGQ